MTVDIRTSLRRRRRRIIFDAIVGRRRKTELEGGRTVEVDNSVRTSATTHLVGRAVHIVTDTTDLGDIRATEAVIVRIESHTGQSRQMVDMLGMRPLPFNRLITEAIIGPNWRCPDIAG